MSSIANKFIFCVLTVTASVFMAGCHVYSFTGASISPDVKTANVKFFTNIASLAPPTITQTLTEALKDRLNSQTSLSLVSSGGDLIFESQVSDYKIAPIAIQGNETAASNRLTITINVKFTNAKDERQNFEKSFSRFADYPGSSSLTAKEPELIDEIKQQLIQDIFNASIANW